MIRPGAFDHFLRHPRASTTCVMHHMGTGGTIGSIFDGTLRLWTDAYGLAFACGPLVPSATNAWAVKSITGGVVRGCSWRAVPAEMAIEKFEGAPVRVIRRFQHLSHISPLAGGMYPAAGAWCSHEHPDDLPEHLKPLARRWGDSRPAANPSRVARAEAPRRQAPSRAGQAVDAYHQARTRRRGTA